ncbi:helix-turn-helix transcriptional regulator [Micromonospora sp. SCSIO 07396]
MTDYLDSAELAARLGIQTASVHRMRSRGDLPEPDRMIGRSPAWRPATIDAWQASRPGHGWRGTSTDPAEPAPVDEPLPLPPLPPGDIHFDGEALSVGGQVLAPGRYAVGDSGAVLTVEPPAEDDDLP